MAASPLAGLCEAATRAESRVSGRGVRLNLDLPPQRAGNRGLRRWGIRKVFDMIDSEAILDEWRGIMNEAIRNEWRGILCGEWEAFRLRMLSRNVTRVMADVGEDCMELSSYNTGNALMTALGMADPGRSYSNLIYEWVANHIHPVRLVVWLELDFKDNTVAYQSIRSRGLTREAPRRRLLDGSYDLR